MMKRATFGLVLGFLAIGTAFLRAESVTRLWLAKEALARDGMLVTADVLQVDERGQVTLRFENEVGAILRVREDPLPALFPWVERATARAGATVSLWYDPLHPERCTTHHALIMVRWLLGGLAVLFSAGVALVLASVRALRLPATTCR